MNTAYSDYEKIIPSEKLPQFLFDFFDRFKEVAWVKNTEKESFYQTLQLNVDRYSKNRFLVRFLDRIFSKLYSNKNPFLSFQRNKKNILFRPFKYYNIILGAKKYQKVGLINHGNWDRFFAVKNFIGYIVTSDLDQYILSYLKENNIKYLYRLIEEVENKLRIAKPDYIVLWSDVLPIERAIVLASKKLGIITLEIQHGIDDSFWPIESGKFVDYLLVWGKYFADLYEKQNVRKSEDIYILGYPYLIEKNKDTKKKDKNYIVYYLGTNLEFYNEEFFDVKMETIKKINEICNKLRIKFFYRPHPGENRELLKKNLKDIAFTDTREGLQEAFKTADIFISFQSTSLVEATMSSKVSLQLMNYPIKSDNFEALGACSASFQTIEELEDYLKKIASAKNLDKFKTKFNNNYIETRYNPIERFLEIIKDIERKNTENQKLKFI
ncbi:MAG: hypothetical protein HY005_01315 [Candidatus Staskawiczbacteria bacterium]|nr:hypothetical protein [Candidatus Staskawiczbacteria bacterium]MBI3337246.1 hypothetical protein [Candidatus Staskawiczbacteria bacterium]